MTFQKEIINYFLNKHSHTHTKVTPRLHPTTFIQVPLIVLRKVIATARVKFCRFSGELVDAHAAISSKSSSAKHETPIINKSIVIAARSLFESAS